MYKGGAMQEWQQEWCHPRAEYLMEEWGMGVDIRYEGDRVEEVLADNNPSWKVLAQEAADIVNKEVEAVRWIGPFITPPMGGFKQTPMALVEETDKVRHITNAKMGA